MSYIIIVVLVIFGLAGIRIADQYVRGVVFRLGRYHSTKGPGLYWIIPLIEWQRRVDLRINTAAVEPQETITRDNVPIKINAVIWRRIVNPAKAVIEVRDVGDAVLQVAVTSLRKEIGRHSLDDVLRGTGCNKRGAARGHGSRPALGVKVERVEMKNIEIPPTMQRAMAQEAEALREKRARIIKAEAESQRGGEVARRGLGVIMQVPAGLELRRMQMITEAAKSAPNRTQ